MRSADDLNLAADAYFLDYFKLLINSFKVAAYRASLVILCDRHHPLVALAVHHLL